MIKKETAEEKLLKIIEATKKGPGVASSGASAVVVNRSAHRFSFNVHQINSLLIVLVVSSIIYLGYEVRNGLVLLEQNVSITADSASVKGSLNIFVPPARALAYYLDKISTRNIFLPFEKKDPSSGATSGKTALENKLKQYKFVGVAWLDVPESASVMFEDTASGATRFLNEGDKLDDVTIKTIYTDRVVVGYENEEMVIKL